MKSVNEPRLEPVRRWLERDAQIKPVSTSDGPSSDATILHESGFLTSFYEQCATCLRIASQRWIDVDVAERRQRLYTGTVLRGVFERFLLLKDAFSSGKVEICLTNHHDLAKAIAGALHDIAKLLLRSVSRFSHLYQDTKAVYKLKEYLEQAKVMTRNESSDSEVTDTSSSSSEDDNVSFGKAKARIDCDDLTVRLLAKHVDLLLQLCPSIETLYDLKHRTNTRSIPPVQAVEVAKAAHAYTSAVQAKFPTADEQLVIRLGQADWERHKRLRANTLEQPSLPTKLQFRPASTFRDSALGSSVAPSSRITRSVASHSSFASSEGGGDERVLRVPDLPKEAGFDQPFECPYCRDDLTSVKSRVDWKIHVFADLQAYICIHNDCPDMLVTFPTRKEWFEHEFRYHLSRNKYQCQLCANTTDSQDDLLSHFTAEDNLSWKSPQLRASTISTATTYHLQPAEKLQCPLCHVENFCSTHRQYATHVGRHLEDIALRSLPPPNDFDDPENVPSKGSSSGIEDSGDPGPAFRATTSPDLEESMKVPNNAQLTGQQQLRTQGSRDIRQDDWDRHRTVITRLYVEEGLTLARTIQKMKVQYAFEATTRQYKVQIRRWALRRNMSVTNAAHILRLYYDAEANGCTRRVFLHGKEKTRADCARYLKKSALVNDEMDLLQQIDAKDSPPVYITFQDFSTLGPKVTSLDKVMTYHTDGTFATSTGEEVTATSRNIKGPSHVEWEAVREKIRILYWQYPLREVKRSLEAQGFRATERMFKSRISSWGFNRKSTDKEYQVALLELQARKAEHKPNTVFIINGRQRTVKDLHKHIKGRKMSDDQFLTLALENESAGWLKEVQSDVRAATPDIESETEGQDSASSPKPHSVSLRSDQGVAQPFADAREPSSLPFSGTTSTGPSHAFAATSGLERPSPGDEGSVFDILSEKAGPNTVLEAYRSAACNASSKQPSNKPFPADSSASEKGYRRHTAGKTASSRPETPTSEGLSSYQPSSRKVNLYEADKEFLSVNQDKMYWRCCQCGHDNAFIRKACHNIIGKSRDALGYPCHHERPSGLDGHCEFFRYT